ncbi:MAG: type II toxin-antitoxin system VapC family toxin [Clostridiales bacterium]|jgi:PIN domain nuclease of toxin-antitoxin system|nr:type II toxin-antitoxin system VapC family toxin [Clostridiales bacterium]
MKRLLLDTHVVLWIAENSLQLKDDHRKLIADESVEKFVSIASVWEIAIKLGRENFHLEGGLGGFLQMIKANNLPILPIKEEYLHLIPTMPKFHKDPFDRLLIAAAKAENMTLMTIDANIHKYAVSWFW